MKNGSQVAGYFEMVRGRRKMPLGSAKVHRAVFARSMEAECGNWDVVVREVW